MSDHRTAPLTIRSAFRQEVGWATLAFLVTASLSTLPTDGGPSWTLALAGWAFTVAVFTVIAAISDRAARRAARRSVS